MGRWGENLFDDDAMLDAIILYEMEEPSKLAVNKLKMLVDNKNQQIDVDDAAEALVGLLYLIVNFGYEFEGMDHLSSLSKIPNGFELDISKQNLLRCCKSLSNEQFNYMAEGIDPNEFNKIMKFIQEEM